MRPFYKRSSDVLLCQGLQSGWMNNHTLLSLSPDLIAHRLSRVENVTVIDMSEVAYYTDYFIVGTVTSKSAMHDSVAALRELARETKSRWHIEQADEWTLVDMGGCIVHLFTPSGRRHWRLDQLWAMLPQRAVEQAQAALA